ncbi:hypothetical protein [Paraburkholderia agricolaris]|uniref:hypothetical protein n=1 Tax=Paraburkholderia agricolaris TaxID=2152888 RepID=UPI001291BCAC|nr:hypothetical protein [Paraburkholderia agricolaris]
MKWTEIVETFALKYPQVQIVRQHLEGIPEAFVVWRSSEGVYSVDLYQTKEKSFSWVFKTYAPYSPRIAAIAKETQDGRWWERCDTRISTLTAERTQYFLGHALNWGLFGYSCSKGIGEFCRNDLGFDLNFVDAFVLEEDRHLFKKRSVY